MPAQVETSPSTNLGTSHLPLGQQPLTVCPCEEGSECLMGHQLLPADQNTRASHPLTNPGTAKLLCSLATTLRSMIVDHNIIINIALQGRQSKIWPHPGPGAVWRKLTKPHLTCQVYRPLSWEELHTHLTFLISITEKNTKSPSSKGTPKRRLQKATHS